mgnify:CR=1 FL=1
MNKARQEIDWWTVLSRTILFLILWWALTDGADGSWLVGGPVVVCALVASVALRPKEGIVWRELLLFVPYFLWHSLIGGIDVARRAFHPRMPIAPQLVEYPLRLPPGLPQVTLVNVMSLLPGTLGVELEGQLLKIHLLDGRGDYLPDLKRLERRVGRIWVASADDFSRG